MNHVMAEIELESFVLKISTSCRVFDVALIGRVKGWKKKVD